MFACIHIKMFNRNVLLGNILIYINTKYYLAIFCVWILIIIWFKGIPVKFIQLCFKNKTWNVVSYTVTLDALNH